MNTFTTSEASRGYALSPSTIRLAFCIILLFDAKKAKIVQNNREVVYSPLFLLANMLFIGAIVHSCFNILEVIITTIANHSSIKVIGANGQISLGKQYAGRQVQVEVQVPGVWLVRTATIIPDNERWLHQAKTVADLQNALSWAQDNTPTDNNVDTLLDKLHGQD